MASCSTSQLHSKSLSHFKALRDSKSLGTLLSNTYSTQGQTRPPTLFTAFHIFWKDVILNGRKDSHQPRVYVMWNTSVSKMSASQEPLKSNHAFFSLTIVPLKFRECSVYNGSTEIKRATCRYLRAQCFFLVT